MLAKDLMTKHVSYCTTDTTVRTAAQIMKDEDCGCLPVKTRNREAGLAGLVTDRDLICRVLADGMDANETVVSNVMTTDVVTIDEDATDEECVQLMSDRQIRRLVVTDQNGNVSGILSQGDVARQSNSQQTAKLVKSVSQ